MGDRNTVTFSYQQTITDDEFAFPLLTWKQPSVNAYGSMPLGNGDIGINLWVEQDGDLLFYISKTDSYSEDQQLLKLGRVRVHFGSNPFRSGEAFLQVLDIQKGEIAINVGAEGNELRLLAWVDAHHPVIRLEMTSQRPVDVHVSLELWRTAKREVTNPKETHSYMMQDLQHEKVTEWPDTIVDSDENALIWYHRNEISAVTESLKRQDLEALVGIAEDPLLGLTFGGVLSAAGLRKISPTHLQASGIQNLQATCVVIAKQTPTADDWLGSLAEVRERIDLLDIESARTQHRHWWGDFWERSHIRVSGSAEADKVTRAYELQRFMHACSGRGKLPIKFNGSIFTTCHEDEGWNPDYRLWGGSYWIQNTRLSYWPMLMDGDFELMKPFFDLYWNNLPVARARARQLGSEGAVFPETMTIFGTCNTDNYGYERPADLPPGLTENTYIRRYWQGSIEIASMMLEFFEFTEDLVFGRDRMVPFSLEVLRFYHGYYGLRDENGKVWLSPSQSLETWHEAINPTPDIAALRWLLQGLLRHATLLTAEESEFCTRYLDLLPALPTRSWFWTGRKIILPALVYDQNSNWENPELYAVFPYRFYGVGKPDLERGVATFHDRLVKGTGCWMQDAIHAAMLGLTEDAKRDVIANSSHFHAKSRFQAFWDSGGRGFDWIPDQDHGGVSMIALQRMLMQCDDEKIRLFPAWPSDWDVDFKLHAPGNTVVEGTFHGGKISRLQMTPPERRADVVVCAIDAEPSGPA